MLEIRKHLKIISPKKLAKDNIRIGGNNDGIKVKINFCLLKGNKGEVAEWFKAHAWKVCVPLQVPWVRIPLSPPYMLYSGKVIYTFEN